MHIINLQDYYDILGVTKSADIDQITKSYKKLAIKWHPDKHTDKDDKLYAEEMFKSISSAYSVLSDEHLRKIYDTHGIEGIKGSVESYKPFYYTEYFNKIINPLKNFSFVTLLNDKYHKLSNFLHSAEYKPFSSLKTRSKNIYAYIYI